MAAAEVGSERAIQAFINGMVPFIREIVQDVLAEEFDLGDQTETNRSRTATSGGDNRHSGGQGRVKDPDHDKRLKENQSDETPYQRYSAASKEEIKKARSGRQEA